MTTVQKTKLFLPPAREELVDRPRLLDKLDFVRSPGYQLALISAPAGYGKTTLVVQWLEKQGVQVGWVSLDVRDNLPSRFFGYLIAALQTVVPGAGNEALPLLGLPGLDLDEVVTRLANDLVEAVEPFVFVLDDFHTITNPVLHDALDLLVEAQLEKMRLLILTREDPALQLAKRRARGQLVELRQEDLRFTLQEAVTFINSSMGLDLSTGQVEALESRTEGWIAGLQMAALSLQRSSDPGSFIREFSGTHRFILDYLLEEVLSHQTQEVQDFLMETAIFDRMSASLCAATTGLPFSRTQMLLEHLAKANLFVVPLDDTRQWYRYHHLFSDLLLARLQSENPERAADLYRSASEWYEENGEPHSAVDFAFKANLPLRAADLIEHNITDRWKAADLDFFAFVNRLPPHVVADRPSLSLNSAWLCMMTGQIDRILPLIDVAEQRLHDPERLPEPVDASNRAFARALRAYLSDMDNQPVDIVETFDQALAAIPEENTGMRNSAAIMIGTIYYMEGDFARAKQYFLDALERDKRVSGTNAVPISIMRLTWMLLNQGKLREAVDLISQHVDYLRERGSRRFYIGGVLHLLWGEVLLEWNQLEEAEAQVRLGLKLLEDWPTPSNLALGLSLWSRLKTARVELAEARSTLERVEEMQRKTRFHPQFLAAINRASVRLWIAEQNWAALETWTSQYESLVSKKIRFRYEAPLIELCRAWLALGRKDEAIKLLDRLALAAQERSGSRLVILTLLAAARSEEPALEEALRLGEPEGYLRTFFEAGESLHQLLKAWLHHGPSRQEPALRNYAQRVLGIFEGIPVQNEPAAGLSMPEKLSNREHEVLVLVAQGLTNQQIASRLYISIRTVKKHVENIHGKLDVHNRTQAVARAHEFGLIPTKKH